jgi:hypothetical protein
MHEEIQFLGWTLPVFTGQAVQRYLFDAKTGALFYGASNAGDTATVTFDTRQILTLSPPTVAVHDDCDVPWLSELIHRATHNAGSSE